MSTLSDFFSKHASTSSDRRALTTVIFVGAVLVSLCFYYVTLRLPMHRFSTLRKELYTQKAVLHEKNEAAEKALAFKDQLEAYNTAGAAMQHRFFTEEEATLFFGELSSAMAASGNIVLSFKPQPAVVSGNIGRQTLEIVFQGPYQGIIGLMSYLGGTQRVFEISQMGLKVNQNVVETRLFLSLYTTNKPKK